MISARKRWIGLPYRAGAIALITSVLLPAALAQRGDSRDSWQQPDRVTADLNLRPGQTVADIGAGGGYFTFRLASAVGQTGKVYATDIDAKPLQAVTDRARREKFAQVETVLSAPTQTKLKDDCLEAALVCDVLHHVPKDQRLPLVKDITRSLKPGGCLFLVDWRVDAKIDADKGRRIPRDELVKLAADAGLTLDAEYHYLVHQVFLRMRKPAADTRSQVGVK